MNCRGHDRVKAIYPSKFIRFVIYSRDNPEKVPKTFLCNELMEDFHFERIARLDENVRLPVIIQFLRFLFVSAHLFGCVPAFKLLLCSDF